MTAYDSWDEDDLPSASDIADAWADLMTPGEIRELNRQSRADVAAWSRPDEAA